MIGVDIDFWSQRQTLSPKRKRGMAMYSGHEPLRFEMDWWEYVPEIPLAMRYASFKSRLAAAQKREREHG